MYTSSKTLQFNTFFLTIVFLSISILSTAIGNEEKAKELFKEQHYENALPLFEELNTLYPSDASFQYYYGVCLTETGNFGAKAKKLLLLATQNDVPNNALYYIGKNYHALNDFTTALSYYNRFSESAKKKEIKAIGVQENIEYCQKKINPFNKIKHSKTIEEPIAKKINDSTRTPSLSKDNYEGQDKITSILDIESGKAKKETELITTPKSKSIVEKPLNIPSELKDSIFDFILTSEIIYHRIEQFRTTKGKNLFIKGWINSTQLKQKLIKTKQSRSQYELEQSMVKKDRLAQQLLDMELEIFQLKSHSDQYYMQSRKTEIVYWNKATDQEKKNLKKENEAIQKRRKNESTFKKFTPPAPQTKIETVKTATIIKATGQKTDEEKKDNKLSYKIQIGAYSKGLPEYIERLYKKLSYLRKIDHYSDNKGVVVYTVGEVSNFEDAQKLQHQIRQEGVKDAFVVAYYQGKRITLSEAKEISQQ